MTAATTKWAALSDGHVAPWQRDWIRHILDTRNAGVLKRAQPDIDKKIIYLVTNYYVSRYVPEPLKSKTGANDWESIALFLASVEEKKYVHWQLSKHFVDYHRWFELPLPFGQNGNKTFAKLVSDSSAAGYMATFLTLREQARVASVYRATRRSTFRPVKPPAAPTEPPADDEPVRYGLERGMKLPRWLMFPVLPFGRSRLHG